MYRLQSLSCANVEVQTTQSRPQGPQLVGSARNLTRGDIPDHGDVTSLLMQQLIMDHLRSFGVDHLYSDPWDISCGDIM